ncbi:MAG: hypothetical protein CHACPFDD_01525 [Phycisphaerae bacterium]|nr:hypothetical protein [Phycisphaerae bacterium]
MLSTLAARSLLRDIIDYAGLFPPASLALPEAVEEFVRQRRHPAAGELVARFICPARKLANLLAIDAFRRDAEQRPWRLSVLGTAARDAGAWQSSVGEDVEHIGRFTGACKSAAIEAYETRLSDDMAGGPAARSVHDVLRRVVERLDAAGRPAVYFEVPLAGEWRRDGGAAMSAIGRLRDSVGDRASAAIGVKLRTGGVEASAFPDAERVAFVAAACLESGLPLKATAGLHHPVRHFNAGVGARMHGFLNLFGGLALLASRAVDAQARVFDELVLQRMLDDEDAAAFRFSDAAFAWREYAVSVEGIVAARRTLAASFGSCSIQEPLDDLRALGLIAPWGAPPQPRRGSAGARPSIT